MMECAMRRILAAVSVLAMTGCITGTNSAMLTVLAPARGVGQVVECDSGCKTEWERTQLWFAKHSSMKVQTATDVMLQTYNTVGSDPSYSFSATKEPIGGGRYRISVAMACGNMFGCSPAPADVHDAAMFYIKTGRDIFAGMAPGMSIR
jgi:hypothetical protein